MLGNNERWNTAKMAGNNGFDVASTETLTPTSGVSPQNRWFAFTVDTAATITAVTLVYDDGTSVSGFTPTWLNTEIAAGMYCPFGVYNGRPIYCTSITVSGKILLYFD